MKILALRGAILLSLVVGPVAHAAETLNYVVLVDNGKKSGEMVVEHGEDGRTKSRFIFKDNGRGPELSEEYTLRPDGTYATYQVTGTTTFGAKVDERFVRDGDQARWNSTSENEQRDVSGSPLFIPLGGTPQGASVAIAAIARRGDGTLPLLPGGTLRQQLVQTVEVEGKGGKRRVDLLVQRGLGLNPQFVWATQGSEGNAPRLFGFMAPGFFAAIESGWEANVEKLSAAQVAAEGTLVKELAGRQFKKLDGLAVIRNTRVFDSHKGTLGGASDVYVLRGRITAVVPTGTPDAGSSTQIDAGGRVLLPGLFDMHAHVFGRWGGGLDLAAGVTSVRDMGNDNATLQKLIDEIATGQLLAPQVIPAGFLEGESDFSARNGFVIKTLPEARHAIDWYVQHGYPQLKIYNSFPKEILKDTVAYAHSRGLRVSGHVPAFLRAQDVVDAGFDEIQHINQVMLNFFVEPTTDTRTLERFRLPAEHTAALDFDSPRVQEFIASLKARNVAIDPTLTTFDYIRQRAGEVSKAYAAVIDHLPLDLQRSMRVAEMDIPDEATAVRYNKSYEKMVEFVGRLHKAGITIIPGTDAIPGFTLHRELELYVQAGMTPAEALQSATSVSARIARVDSERGSIEPGKFADLVLVDGDPTKDINAIRKVVLVLTQGRVVSPSAVYTELGIKPFVASEPKLVRAQ